MDRIIILLSCEKCKRKNYSTTKSSKKTGGEKLQVKKFCHACRAHTLHKETKA